MDKNKALKTLDKLLKQTSLKVANPVINDLCDDLDYFDPPKKLKTDNNYSELTNYLEDLVLVGCCGTTSDTAAEFIEGIEDTETDLLTYLDNFVNDDTKYDTVEKYISSDFKDIHEFTFHLIKNYFKNNLEIFIGKIEK